MKHGQIAGNNSINATIYKCFEYLCEHDERIFVKKFKQLPHNSDQVMHTFRELVLGAYLISIGFKAKYDRVVEDQRPDWSIFDAEGDSIVGIVELMNFQIDKATELDIAEQMRIWGVAGYWRDTNKDNVERLYQALWRKITAYKSLAKKLGVAYIVSVFSDFKVIIDRNELNLCLFEEKSGLFAKYPELGGVIIFEEASGQYSFYYEPNPEALFSISLLSGIFPPGAAQQLAPSDQGFAPF